MNEEYIQNDFQNPHPTDLQTDIQNIICKIRMETSVSETDFKIFMNYLSAINSIILTHLNIPEQSISHINSILSKNKTFDSQQKNLSSQICYVQPQTIILSQKSEIRIRNGKSILKTVKESFSYVPNIKTFISVIQNPYLLDLIENEILSPCAGN